MAINELDSLEQGNAPAAVNEYDQMLADESTEQKQQIKGAMFAGSRKEPARQAQVLELSQKSNLPPSVVDRNFDTVKQKLADNSFDYDAMIEKTPGLAKWMENADNAALGRDDLNPLGEINKKSMAIANSRTGMAGDLGRAVQTGFRGIESSSWHLAAAYGLATPEEAAEQVAAANKRSQELRAQMPDYAIDFNDAMARESGDVNKAFDRFTGSFESMREGKILKALQDFSVGQIQTVGEAIDMVAAAAIRPRGLLYSTAENIANSAPALATGMAAAKGGAAIGALTGPAAPVAVPALSVIGMGAGSFLGAVPVEVGAWINSEMTARGVDTTDPQAITAAYKDAKMMADIRAEAERKGVTTAGVDALFNAFAGRLVKAKTGSMASKAVAGVKEVGIQAAGEVSSEYAGQVAAKGGVKGTNFAEALQEGIISLGHSTAEVAVGTSMRKAFSKAPAKAAEEIATSTQNAIQSLHEAEQLAEIGKAAQELKNTGNVPGKIAELIQSGVAPEAVYFQADDWDSYWRARGKSPAKAAEQMMDDGGKAYFEAKLTGQDIKIPFSQYVDRSARTEDFEGLLDSAKTSPEAMSVKQAQEHLASLPATMNELAKEAMPTEGQSTPDQSAAAVGEEVGAQLKAIGVDPEQAVLYEEGFRVLGERMGMDPKQLFDEFKLRITDQLPAQAGDQSFDQPARAVVFPVKQSNEGVFSVNPGDGLNAAARIVDGKMQIEGLYFDKKYQGVGQDMIRSLEKSAIAGGAFSMEAKATSKRLEEVYALQGFEVQSRDKDGAVMFKDLSAKRTYNQDNDNEADRLMRAETMGFDTSKKYYHGTNKEFDSFKPSRGGYVGPGIYVTSNKGAANNYGDKVMPIYLKVKKPLDLQRTKNGDKSALKVAKELGIDKEFEARNKKRFKSEITYGVLVDAFIDKNDPEGKLIGTDKDVAFHQAIQSLGYDAIDYTHNSTDARIVFSPDQIRSTDAAFREDGDNIYNQEGEAGPLGQINISKNGIEISITKNANASTFFHETGHFYLEVLKDLAARDTAPQQIKDDWQSIRDWLGAEGDLTVDQHEQFARGFEGYLLEGKAPTSKLAAAFSRFKTWLISVYRRMRPVTEFSPEVKDVMNRVFATDEEIRLAQGDFPILFEDPAATGMNEKQAERYMQARQDAKVAAEAELSKKIMRDFRRSEKAWFKQQREAVETEVRDDLVNSREYAALAVLQSDLPSPDVFKISKSSLKAMGFMPSDLPRATTSDDGLHVEQAALALGFRDAAELVEKMSGIRSLEEGIKKETDRRMAEYYPDSLTDGSISEEAMKSMHNEKRAELLEMELQHLVTMDLPVAQDVIRRVVRRPPTLKQIRKEAVRIIGTQKTAGDQGIKPHLYQRAEIKAAKEAGVALAKGDLDAAFEAKQRELLNHELYREATRAREIIDEAMVDFRKFRQSNEKLAKNREMNLVDTARAILAAFGVGPTGSQPDLYLSQEILSKMQKYDPDNFEVAKALFENATENGTGRWQDIPFDDFVAMKESVDALWDLSRNVKQIEVNGQKMDLEQAKEELINQAAKFVDPNNKKQYTETAGKWDKAKSKLMSAKADLIRVEHWAEAMDVTGNREFTNYIVSPVFDGVTKYRLNKNRVLQEYRAVIESHAAGLSRDPIVSDELGHKFKNKAELMMAVLHSGNESNLRKLLVGRGWGQADETGRLDTTKWDQFIQRAQQEGILTKADYDFAQKVWDLLESLKGDAQIAHKQMHGYYFNEITASEIQTPYGVYRGGYIPAKVDVNESEDADIRAERESFEKTNNSYQFPTTGRGFTKSRVEQYAAPLSLDMNLLGGHIDAVLRFTHIEPRVKEVSRIVMDKGFREALRQVDPAVAKDALIPWLQRSAQQQVVTPSRDGLGRLTDAMASFLRRNVAMQVMFGNVTNTLQQLTGVVVAGAKIKPKYLRNAVVSYISDMKNTATEIQNRSDWMRSTQGSNTFETAQAIQEILIQPSTFESIQDFMQRHTYFLQSATQNFVNNIVWMAGYNEALESGVSESEAVKSADSKVRMTQGTVNPEDVSRFETGTQTERLFKQFVGYFNMLANLNGFELQKIARETGLRKGAGRAFYVYSMGLMIPALLSEAIVRAMSGKGFDEDDDDNYLDDALSAFFGSQFKTIAATVPYGGQFAVSAYNRFNSQRYDDRLSLSPVLNVLEGVAGTPYELYRNIAEDVDNEKKLTKDSLQLIGIMSSLPSGPIGRPVGYIMDVRSGRAQPTGPVDYARGLITGKSGQ